MGDTDNKDACEVITVKMGRHNIRCEGGTYGCHISISPSRFAAIMYLVLFGGLALSSVLACGLLHEMVARDNRLGLTIGSLMFVACLAAAVLSIIAGLQSAFLRRLEFEKLGKTCILRNIPGFEWQVPLDEILAVEIATTANRSAGWLGLLLRKRDAVLVVFGASTVDWKNDGKYSEVERMGKAVSAVVGCPVAYRQATGTISDVMRWHWW